jgi:hypothetical protein
MGRKTNINKDRNKIIKNNSKVSASELSRNLDILEKLKENGINVGPNYNLSSPYARPNPNAGTSRRFGDSSLHVTPIKKL